MFKHQAQILTALCARRVNQSTLTSAISIFKPFKSAGPDGNIPTLLQCGRNHYISPLSFIFKSCLACGYTPVPGDSLKGFLYLNQGYRQYQGCHVIQSISHSVYLNHYRKWQTYIRQFPLH